VSEREQKNTLEDLRKQVSARAWEFYDTIFQIKLGRGQLSEDDRLSYMEDQVQRGLQRRAGKTEYDPSRARISYAALSKTQEYQEVFSEDGKATYERYRERAASLLNQLVAREITAQEGQKITPNDPTYPRREAEKLVVAALYDCTWLMECAPPSDVVELAMHLLLRPKFTPVRQPDGETVWIPDREPDDFMILWGRGRKYYAAAEYLALNPEAPDREVARKANVDHKTIPRWKKEPHFIDYQKCYLRQIGVGNE
jgi:hypothetical protein